MPVTYQGYSDPGVYITQSINPTVTTQASLNPTVVCLVGPTQYLGQKIADNFTNPATTSVNGSYTLGTGPTGTNPATLGINQNSIIAIYPQNGTRAYSGSTPPAGSNGGRWYVEGVDYDYSLQINPSTTLNPQDTTGTLTINSSESNGNIPPGENLHIVYMAAPGDYYQVFSFNNANDVFSVYGQPLFSSAQITAGVPTPYGPQINSPLSLAAWFAFQNGANTILTLAVFSSAGPEYSPSTTDWDNSFTYLLNEIDIDVVVPITGDPDKINFAYNFVETQYTNNFYMRMFCGPGYDPGGDTYQTVASCPTSTDLVNMATNNGYVFGESTRTSIFAPPYVNWNTASASSSGSPQTGTIPIGSCYLAAAAAGIMASTVGPWIPITNQQIRGSITIPNQLSAQQLIQEQANGICVVYQNRQGNSLIKHGLTTDMSNFLTQEISVMATTDKMFDFILQSINSNGLIGSPFLPTTPNTVLAIITAALTQAQSVGMIYGFSGLSYQINQSLPTTVLVSFTYQPTLPLNFINVQMSIDSTAGTTTFQANPLASNSSTG